jgi:hypothetical protein
MCNRKRRLAERQLIKIMDTHLVTKARNMDEKEKRTGGRSRGRAAAQRKSFFME